MPITYVSLADAAKDLGVAPSTLRHQIRLQRFTAVKIGRGWFARPEAVEDYRINRKRVAA